MKKIIMLLLIAFTTKAGWAQYKPVEQGSSLKFTIKNLGFGVDGSFTGFDGSITFDPQNTATATFDVSVNAATVNTDNNLRDEHLKADGYFDVKNNPRIRMVSDKITGKNGSYVFNGQLTIKGKTKPVSFPFTSSAVSDGLVFKGSFKINRRDFGVGGTSTISDELQVNLNIIAKK